MSLLKAEFRGLRGNPCLFLLHFFFVVTGDPVSLYHICSLCVFVYEIDTLDEANYHILMPGEPWPS
jgi:hypothetical protein